MSVGLESINDDFFYMHDVDVGWCQQNNKLGDQSDCWAGATKEDSLPDGHHCYYYGTLLHLFCLACACCDERGLGIEIDSNPCDHHLCLW